MREHKYRVWDKEDKKYIFYSGIFNSAPFTETSGWLQYEGSCPRYHDIIVEEAIGLEDISDMPIYEGDILKINGGSNYLVKWFNDIGFDGMGGMHSGFYFDNKYRGNTELDYHLGFYKEEIEVVGNINENPELLTGKSNE